MLPPDTGEERPAKECCFDAPGEGEGLGGLGAGRAGMGGRYEAAAAIILTLSGLEAAEEPADGGGFGRSGESPAENERDACRLCEILLLVDAGIGTEADVDAAGTGMGAGALVTGVEAARSSTSIVRPPPPENSADTARMAASASASSALVAPVSSGVGAAPARGDRCRRLL